MPSNIPTPVIDLKAFVPAEDFALSRQFYAEMGFHSQWAEGNAAELRLGSFGFILQNFYVEQHAGNFMMHLMVENSDVWWQHIAHRDGGIPRKVSRHRDQTADAAAVGGCACCTSATQAVCFGTSQTGVRRCQSVPASEKSSAGALRLRIVVVDPRRTSCGRSSQAEKTLSNPTPTLRIVSASNLQSK